MKSFILFHHLLFIIFPLHDSADKKITPAMKPTANMHTRKAW